MKSNKTKKREKTNKNSLGITFDVMLKWHGIPLKAFKFNKKNIKD